ncbi:MAG: hypothetical protein ACTSWE_00455 [Promethearchaeota archaeon]
MSRTIEFFLKKSKSLTVLNSSIFNNTIKQKLSSNILFIGNYVNDDIKFLDLFNSLKKFNSNVQLIITLNGFLIRGYNYSKKVFFKLFLNKSDFYKYQLKNVDEIRVDLSLNIMLKRLRGCNARKDSYLFKITTDELIIDVPKKGKRYQSPLKYVSLNDLPNLKLDANNILEIDIAEFRDFLHMPANSNGNISFSIEKNSNLVLQWNYNRINCKWEIPLNKSIMTINGGDNYMFKNINMTFYSIKYLKRIFDLIKPENSTIKICKIRFNENKNLEIKYYFGIREKSYFYYTLSPTSNNLMLKICENFKKFLDDLNETIYFCEN